MCQVSKITFPSMKWLWLALGVTAVSLLLLILMGTFDPSPAGPMVQLPPWEPLTLPAGQTVMQWATRPLPPPPYTLCLHTQRANGETDLVYGLLLGHPDESLVVAVSPLGYAGIWQGTLLPTTSPATTYLFPWQPWPHIHPTENEIWLDVQNGRLRVRLNREWLWEGDVTLPGTQVAVLGHSYGETAVLKITPTCVQ